MTLEAALSGSCAPPEILENQSLLCVPHWNFVGEMQIGHIVVARELCAEVSEIFRQILIARFPIFHMTPIVAFNWDDNASMAANNCSAFNFRPKVGSQSLSRHAFGRAIDINPRQNPYITADTVLPPNAVYDTRIAGTIQENDAVVAAFERAGWQWGGRWSSPRDFHHFEKS